MQGEMPHSRLAKAIYTLNHLTIPQYSNNPVILTHFLSLQSSNKVSVPHAKVLVRDLISRKWEGPWDLVTWGRGYACVSTDCGLQWIPARKV